MEVASPPEPFGAGAASVAPAPTSRQTAFVAVGQAALLAFGGVLALLIAQSFGKNTETDAFFAAYGLYSVGLVFGGTFRLTAVSRLVHAEGPDTITLLIGAVVLMGLIVAVPMVVLAVPLGEVLVAHDPTDAAPKALRVLWIALAGQMLGAMLATVLAVRGRFVAIGVITLLTGVVSTAVFVLTRGPLGVQSAPVALMAGAIWLSAGSLVVLLRSGWRLRRSPRMTRGALRETGALSYASATFVGTNLAYVTTLALASRHGSGEATLYSYAYALAAILVTVTANVSAMLRSPSLVASGDRTGETALASAASFRLTLLVGGLALGVALLIGPPFISLALGSDYSDGDVRSILVTLACMTGWTLGAAGGLFAVVELLARRALKRLALLAAGQVAAVAAAAALGGALAGIAGVAAGLSLVAVAVAVIQIRWAFAAQSTTILHQMTRDCAREFAVLVVGFGPAALVLVAIGPSVAGYAAATVVMLVLAIPVTVAAWPAEARGMFAIIGHRGAAAKRA